MIKKQLFKPLQNISKIDESLEKDEILKKFLNKGGEYTIKELLHKFNEKNIISAKKMKKRKTYIIFADSLRPWKGGTIEKNSTIITGKKPFNKDISLIDYEFDSDDEFEEKVFY